MMEVFIAFSAVMERTIFVILTVVFLICAGKETSDHVPMKADHSDSPFKSSDFDFVFEGVDYDMMPPELFKKNHDCFSVLQQCIRYTVVITPVCGWNKTSYYFHDFHSPCEIDMENCRYREREGKGYYGNKIEDKEIYYNGEGKKCEFFVRSGGNMMEAYFGGFGRRSDGYNDFYQKIRYLPYKVKLN